MNPINFALRHPVTMVMLVVALAGGGGLAIVSMRVDIFPPFNLPQIYVIQNFNGMSPAQMEGLIVNQFELNFQYVDGVKTVESRSIQQIALIKLSFYPETDMAEAMAAVVAQANRAQASMPPGVLPPQIMRMDAGSVPIGYLVLTAKDKPCWAHSPTSLNSEFAPCSSRTSPARSARPPLGPTSAPSSSMSIRIVCVPTSSRRMISSRL